MGGIDPRQLAGKPVWVGAAKTPGVIGAKPIHLTSAGERKKTIPINSLRIDVGPENKNKVKVGDRATFATVYKRIGPSIRAKALDDRLGVATLIELVKHAPRISIYWLLSQSKKKSAYAVPESRHTTLILIWHSHLTVRQHTISPARMRTKMFNTTPGWTLALPFTLRTVVRSQTRGSSVTWFTLQKPKKYLTNSANQAGAVQMPRLSTVKGSGIPSVSVSVPGRYAHTAAGIVRISDWKNTLALIYSALARITPKLFAEDR